MMSDGMLGPVGVMNSKTNLIIHDEVMDISSKATELVYICNIVEKPCNFALLFQWSQFL